MPTILFNEFPREFSTKRLFCNNREEFNRMVNQYNCVIDCYTTIYSIEAPRKYNSVIVDKVFFDLDAPKTCWSATKKLHEHLLKKNLMHVVLFSGGGFHVYIFAENKDLKHPKDAIRNTQHKIASEAGITIGKPKICDVDEHVIGDVARIARIPNTYNFRRKKFCVYLLKEDFDKTLQDIRDMAIKQRFVFEIFGEKKIDIMDFDFQIATVDESLKHIDIDDVEIKDKNITKVIKILPPIIQRLLKDSRDGHRDRYITILAMKEIGLPKKIAVGICKEYWSQRKFEHALIGHGHSQFDSVYKKNGLFFPNWDTLKREGYYITKEDRDFVFYKNG